MNLCKKKWLIYATVIVLVNLWVKSSRVISEAYWISCGNYNNFLIAGDFNFEINESWMHDFCSIYNSHSLCDIAICYKNPEKSSYIDLFQTNFPRSFQNTSTVWTNLSVFNQLVVTVLNYRDLELESELKF